MTSNPSVASLPRPRRVARRIQGPQPNSHPPGCRRPPIVRPSLLPSAPRSLNHPSSPSSLAAVRYYVLNYSQKQINAFATYVALLELRRTRLSLVNALLTPDSHASRYFELYLPSGSIEIAHTSRYSHRTGKSELCILATRPLAPGTVISELKGSMADLTDQEDKELKGTDLGRPESVGIRRDFSVIHSKQLKKNHLFLGPARFVNVSLSSCALFARFARPPTTFVLTISPPIFRLGTARAQHDCEHNVELFREGRYITFRVIKHIGVGEEVTAHYGDGYCEYFYYDRVASSPLHGLMAREFPVQSVVTTATACAPHARSTSVAVTPRTATRSPTPLHLLTVPPPTTMSPIGPRIAKTTYLTPTSMSTSAAPVAEYMRSSPKTKIVPTQTERPTTNQNPLPAPTLPLPSSPVPQNKPGFLPPTLKH